MGVHIDDVFNFIITFSLYNHGLIFNRSSLHTIGALEDRVGLFICLLPGTRILRHEYETRGFHIVNYFLVTGS